MAGLAGRTFGDYQLTEQIGASGVAEVYRASPKTVRPGSREAVVKVIHPEFARQPGFIPNFRRIVEMSKKLATHPHVLPVIASGEESSYLYLVSPYVADGTLQGWLQRGGRLGVGDTGPFFRQLCSALGYAHSMGVTHGNLKPSNIYLFEGRHVLVGDFGLLWDVRQLDMNHRGSGTEAIEYMAPEIFSGQPTHLSDIFSLGSVLYATFVGHAPFHGGEKPADVYTANLTQPVPPLASVAPGLAPALLALDPVIQTAMAKRPEDRIASAALMAQSIEITLQSPVPLQQQAPVASVPVAPMAGTYGAPQQHMSPQAAAQPGAFGGVFNQPIAPVFSAPPAPMPAQMQSPLQAAPGSAPAGAAAAAAAAALTHLNFPPLPPTAQVEEQMETGRHSVQKIQGSRSLPGAPVSAPQPPLSEAVGAVDAAGKANAAKAADASQSNHLAPLSNIAASASFPSTERPVTSRVPAPETPDFPTARVPAPETGGAGKRGRMGFDSAAVDAAFDATFGGAFAPLNNPSVSGVQRFAPRGPTFTEPELGGQDLTGDSFPDLPTITSRRPNDDDPWSESIATRRDRDDEDLWQREWLDGEEPAEREQGGLGARRDMWRDENQDMWSDDTGRHAGVGTPRRSGWDAETGWGLQDSGSLDTGAQQAFEAIDTDSYNRYDAREARSTRDIRGESGNRGDFSREWNEDGFTGEYSEHTDAHRQGADQRRPYPQDSQEYNAFQSLQEYPPDEHAPDFFAAIDDMPFSATELGLPRLTHPVLGDMPVSWQELTSNDGDMQRGHRHDGYLDDEFSQEQAALALSWPGQSDGRRGQNSAPRGANARMSGPSRRNAPPILALQSGPEDEMFGSRDNLNGGRPGGRVAQVKPSGPRGAAAPAEGDDFARQPGWTDKPRKRKRRRIGPIILVAVILLTLIELLTLPVVRPDVCGLSACVAIRSIAHSVFPSLGGSSALAHVMVTTAPTQVQVISGQSATAKLGVENTGAAAAQWQATTSATWLTVAPASGMLAAGGAATLILTAKPVGVSAGSYLLNVTLQAGGASITEPVRVKVAAGATLAYSPQALTFTGATCGVPSEQTLTVQNSGGAALSVTLTPSTTPYVLLNGASQTLMLTIEPSANQTVSVAISCHSSFPHTYSLTLSSNGGAGSVTLHYGA